MSPSLKLYRVTVLLCALEWLMVGIQITGIFHAMESGRRPGIVTVLLLVGFGIGVVRSLWELLLAAPRGTVVSESGAAAG